ncbi:unnamed protein product [Cuscuta epithymum]|uniref:Uncharacterized protein n=1 Tax=Cuscuta epithymum TaxID=186058 RepID=A0AAV0F8Q4_9ASTE|nr:unnamed protein product [Cuscuta epithymum]
MSVQLCYDPSKAGIEVDKCALIPPESGFHLVCLCEECVPKLRELSAFEKEIKSKRRFVEEYLYLINRTQDRSVFLSTAVERTKKMLDLLLNNLSTAYKKSGISFTLQRSASVVKLEQTDLVIARLLVQHDLMNDFENENAIEICDEDDDDDDEGENEEEEGKEEKTDEIIPIGSKIRSLLYLYGETKVKDVAHSLLERIGNLEKELWEAQKSAVGENKPMDPLIPMKCIEEQIRLIKKLPVEELYDEVKELVSQLTHRNEKVGTALAASDVVSNTCDAMIQIRNDFLRKYNKCDISSLTNGNGNKHGLNGFGETLDSLLIQVKLFKDRWETDYAPFFTPYDRLDPKRQRTD